jgi:hypothetical protein
MKVVCVTLDYTDTYTDFITIGKVYDIIEDFIDYRDNLIKIVDDIGHINLYNRKLFKEISIVREEKLKELLGY